MRPQNTSGGKIRTSACSGSFLLPRSDTCANLQPSPASRHAIPLAARLPRSIKSKVSAHAGMRATAPRQSRAAPASGVTCSVERAQRLPALAQRKVACDDAREGRKRQRARKAAHLARFERFELSPIAARRRAAQHPSRAGARRARGRTRRRRSARARLALHWPLVTRSAAAPKQSCQAAVRHGLLERAIDGDCESFARLCGAREAKQRNAAEVRICLSAA